VAATDNGNGRVLRSDWSGINPKLIAVFYPLTRETRDDTSFRWVRDQSEPEVHALVSDGTVEHSINWQSPFEGQNLDQQASTLSGLLQSGAFVELVATFNRFLQDQRVSNSVTTDAQRKLEDLFGKSNVTKLNSTQIFNGLPPMQIPVTVHFRAISNPEIEVEAPARQLIRWSLPQQLAADGVIIGAVKGTGSGLFPSTMPRVVAMRYADMLFAPMVIEAVPYELTGPRDKDGKLINTRMQMRLASLASIDARDWNDVWNPDRYNTAR